MIKGSNQEEVTIINIYAPNTGAPQNIRQMLRTVKGEIDNSTVIVGDFNTPFISVDRSYRQKINKETQALNNTFDLIDIYRTFHPKTIDFTFYSSVHGTFSRKDHILDCDKFKKTEIISSIFSDCNSIILDINYRKIKKKL